ncbi:MAG: hypothetical protein J2P53_10015 [Bradyrhizobiaceae bacterium]|nr:hypothetical protein [Bradyrhizobiaceae bacterium]
MPASMRSEGAPLTCARDGRRAASGCSRAFRLWLAASRCGDRMEISRQRAQTLIGDDPAACAAGPGQRVAFTGAVPALRHALAIEIEGGAR